MTGLLHNKKDVAFTGFVSIAGAISMFLGAACWVASGTDLWQSLANQQMESYLLQLEPVKPLLTACTVFWTLGVLLLGTAGAMMAGFCNSNPRLAQLVLVCMYSAVPVAIVSFIIMLSLAVHPPALDTAVVTGWIGARLDDLATLLIIGACPLFLSLAGRGDWVPAWLTVWGFLAGFTALLGVIGLLTGLVALGFIIIPFGLGWMIAAGYVLIKKSKRITG